MHLVSSFTKGKPETRACPQLQGNAHRELRNQTSLCVLSCSDHASLYYLTISTVKSMPTSDEILMFHMSIFSAGSAGILVAEQNSQHVSVNGITC